MPGPSRHVPLGRSVALALLALIAAPALVLAAYPPGPYPGAGPVGAFPVVVESETVGSAGADLHATSAGVTLDLSVPPGSLPAGTQVTIYGGAADVLAALLPSGATLVDGFAVGWTPSGPAALPLTLTVSDPRIGSGDLVFVTTPTGLVTANGAQVSTGKVQVSFTTDPGIVIAAPSGEASSSPTPGPTGTPAPLPPTTSGNTSPGNSGMPPIVLPAIVVIGILAGGLMLASRSRSLSR